ncbi:hypothetical protein L195_g004671, partial [Trifolium pratense]
GTVIPSKNLHAGPATERPPVTTAATALPSQSNLLLSSVSLKQVVSRHRRLIVAAKVGHGPADTAAEQAAAANVGCL